MKNLFIPTFTILFLGSCLKSRTCTCYNTVGESAGTISVTAFSDKKAEEKCNVVLYDQGDKKKAKEMAAAQPTPACRIQ